MDIRVDRVGIDQGAEVLEVAARIGSDLVMSASAQLAAPKTVYAFPGQGIQHKGMGMEVRARSKAARKVWDTADKFTRETLGFSVLHVVRDNPTTLIASGVHYHHPDGVLFLTQFTQVAMATVAAAQVAEMREQGAFVEGAIACGHSVGEYTALACVIGFYELEGLLEVVFHRGSKMHDIVPRDHLGRSNYRLAAIRPSQIDLDDADVKAFVADIAERTGEFLEIVNFNLRGSQYAIAGTVRGLEALEEEVERRREITGGKRSFILVPGIDVPFHSSVLRVGVADFRHSLERVMPHDTDPDLIIGRYIPNLVPRPFTLDRDFIQEIRDLVPAEPLDEILADYDTWRNEKPARAVPQDRHRAVGLAVRQPGAVDRDAGPAVHRGGRRRTRHRAVRRDRREVRADRCGSGHQHAQPARIFAHSTTEVLNSERDAAVLFATDTDPEPEAEEAPAVEAAVAAGAADFAEVAPVASADAARPDDIAFDAADATTGADRVVGEDAHRPDRAAGLHRVDHRRRVVAAQSAARRPWCRAEPRGYRRGRRGRPGRSLKSQVTKLARTYKPFGPVLSDAINDQLRTALGPSGKRPAVYRRAGQEDLGARRRLGQACDGRGRAGHPGGLQRPRRQPGRSARRCAR